MSIPVAYAFIDVSRQFEHVATTYAFIKKIRKNIAQVHC